MLVLVDFDNIEDRDRRLGVDHVVRKICSLILPSISGASRIRMRFYGGWYEGGRLTNAAQALAAEVRAVTPVRLPTDRATFADVELAVSVLSDPRTTVDNTFRRRGYPRKMRCEASPFLHCASPQACPLGAIEQFLGEQVCFTSGCTVMPEHIFYKAEQKVVDTMLVADLMFATIDGERRIAVVSRDDDVWPGLSFASARLEVLAHVSTVAQARMPSYYKSLPKPPYSHFLWE